mmetsp:Transcript_27589/g.31764  ORF Transcript_27589/g.31764 Transcript_27589/m.31764 type:complete len:338 (-) Transcript_27589:141-1154(-)
MSGQLEEKKRQEGKLEEALDDLRKKIESKRQMVENQNRTFESINDNLKLRVERRSMAELESQLKEKETLLDMSKVTEYKKVQKECNQKLQAFNQERYKSEGKIETIKAAMNNLKAKLKHDNFKNINMRYMEAKVNVTLRKIAVKDLDIYHTAMENALMKYHHQKMEEINQIINELWKTVYKGNDITGIEVKSDTENTSSTVSNRGRSYNYRIIMYSHEGTELDMRGRCSAGQKVLASLIVRMALAEVFCINCGVLALDEPTTNLDKENIEGLATTINELIAVRTEHSNFQLILITHDEEFVRLLNTDLCENYYVLSKNMDQHSEIVKHNIEELHEVV